MAHSPEAFDNFKIEELHHYARRWAEGPLDPRTEKPAWKVPIDRVILYGRTHHHGPGIYVVVFELTDNEHSSTYLKAKDNLDEFFSPKIPKLIDSLSPEDRELYWKHTNGPDEPGLIRSGETLSPEHEEIDKLVTACGKSSTIPDEGSNSLMRLLLDDGFGKKVYKPGSLPTMNKDGLYDEGLFRKEWKFHVLFPGKNLSKVIDERSPSLVLYDEDEEYHKGFKFDKDGGLRKIDREIEDWELARGTVENLLEKESRLARLKKKRERHLAYLRSGNHVDEEDLPVIPQNQEPLPISDEEKPKKLRPSQSAHNQTVTIACAIWKSEGPITKKLMAGRKEILDVAGSYSEHQRIAWLTGVNPNPRRGRPRKNA